jgi:glycerate kinase
VKILIAANALKGCLSARQAADAIEAGIVRALPDAGIEKIPVADGGDGLLDVLATALEAEWHRELVSGPLGGPVEAAFLYCPGKKLAIIEMAAAAGLALLIPEQADPLSASSHGVGELIAAALALGAGQIVLGIGGSATNDGGTGLASALGARFLDAGGRDLPGNGAALQLIRHIDLSGLDPRLKHTELSVACDVDNPLLGDDGAARVYAPQKGATPTQVEQLESGLHNLADVIKSELHRDVSDLPGAGAAGGMGAGLLAFFNARLKPGAQLVLELLDVEKSVATADLVMTCEGRLDEQTRFGKAPAVVARTALAHGVPCIALAGQLGEGALHLGEVGIQAAFSLCPGPLSLEDALKNAPRLLADSAEQAFRCFHAGYTHR